MPPPGRGGGFKKGGFKKGQGVQRKSFDRSAPAERSGPPGAFKKSWGDKPERKGFGFKKYGDERSGPPGAFKKSYDRPAEGAGGARKSFGFKKKPEGERSGPPGAFKKSYGRPAEGGERKSFGFKKPFKRDAPSSDRGGFKKSFNRDAPSSDRGGFKKSFDRGGPKKSFERAGSGGDRPAFSRKSSDQAPGEERVKKYGGRPDAPQSPRVPGATAPGVTPANDGRWVWGINPVLEALRAHPEQVERIYIVDGLLSSSAAAEILSRSRDANLKVDNLERDRLTSMIGGGVHQGVVAEVREYQYKELEDLLELAEESGRPALIVVLDGIQDPHNLGAIIRSAHSFGAHGVVVAKDRAAGVTGMVAKSSAGAIEYCPVARVTNIGRALEQLKEAGCWTVAADPEGDQPAWQAKLAGPLAIVVGAEGPGVRDGVLSKCDFKVLIPMAGKVASLNASVSAGVLLYEVSRQRAVPSVIA